MYFRKLKSKFNFLICQTIYNVNFGYHQSLSINCHCLFTALPKFVKPLQGHSFSDESTHIGDLDDPTCKICVNCSVNGDPQPVVTWEYQMVDNPGVFKPVVTNQSDPTSRYFVENNGQVSFSRTLHNTCNY